MKTASRLLVAAVTVGAAAATATAGLLPNSVTVTPEEGNYRWTYNIVLPTDMKLQSGNFFTVYDFNGYIPGGESAPEGWEFSASKTGPTPDRLRPNDDPEKYNLTWEYTGPTIPSGQIGLGNFWAVSQYGNQGEDWFTAQTNRTSDGLIDRNITDTVVPIGTVVTPPSGIPEPTTLVLAGLGLPVVAGVRAYRRKKAA